MRKKIAAAVAVLSVGLGLGGCTGENMADGIKQGCGFVANQQDVIKLATKIGGALIPGSVFAFDTAETVVSGVCSAYNAQKEVKRESAIRGVNVSGVFVRKG